MNDSEEIQNYKQEWKETGNLFKRFFNFFANASDKFKISFILIGLLDVVGGLIFFGDDYIYAFQQALSSNILAGIADIFVTSIISGNLIAVPVLIVCTSILLKKKSKR